VRHRSVQREGSVQAWPPTLRLQGVRRGRPGMCKATSIAAGPPTLTKLLLQRVRRADICGHGTPARSAGLSAAGRPHLLPLHGRQARQPRSGRRLQRLRRRSGQQLQLQLWYVALSKRGSDCHQPILQNTRHLIYPTARISFTACIGASRAVIFDVHAAYPSLAFWIFTVYR